MICVCGLCAAPPSAAAGEAARLPFFVAVLDDEEKIGGAGLNYSHDQYLVKINCVSAVPRAQH